MKSTTSAAKAVACALACALSAGACALPAAAMADTLPEGPAVVAQSVGSDDAIDAAVDYSPLYWADVASVDWCYDCARDDYVVTLTAWWGDAWVVWVDAATGIAYAIA